MPYLVVLRSDFAETGDERVVAPLSPSAVFSPTTQRLFPAVELDGQQYRMLVPALATLRQPVGNLGDARSAIIAALDYLFFGF